MAEPGDPNYRYSVNEYTTDGTTTEFEVSFDGGYISKEFVRVRYTDSLGAVTYPTFTWVGDYQVSVSPALAAGGSVMIYRNTPADEPIVDFNDGAIINERSLDITARQAVHLAAETRDIVGSIPSLDVLQETQQVLSYALNRNNHTGSQTIATVTGLQAALDAKPSAGDLALKLPITSPTYTGIARNNSASWPLVTNSHTTNATHTNGSTTITVASGATIKDGDGVYASFVSEPVYVVSGGGTNTLVLSRAANSTGTTSTRFGTDRWNLASTTVGDTAGYRRMYIGQAAKGRSTLQPKVNGQGLDYPDVTAFACENELGGVSGWFGSTMSKENTGLAALITLGTYCLIDEDPVSRHCWNGYDQSNLLAGTAPSGSAQFIQRECSLESYWPTVLSDPFYYNEPGSTRIFRLDAGIGTYAERGEPFPNDISHYIDFVANGAKAKKGIIFGYDSLDVGGGTIKPAAIALTGAGWGHSVSWYSGLETESWKIFSTATVGNAYFWHSNGVVTSGEADLAVTKAPGFERALRLLSNNDNRWKVAATASPETGINVGSDFSISRFNDAGAFIASSFEIRRSNGRISMKDVAALDKFVDNAAALSAGLAAGDLYATPTGDLRIVI